MHKKIWTGQLQIPVDQKCAYPRAYSWAENTHSHTVFCLCMIRSMTVRVEEMKKSDNIIYSQITHITNTNTASKKYSYQGFLFLTGRGGLPVRLAERLDALLPEEVSRSAPWRLRLSTLTLATWTRPSNVRRSTLKPSTWVSCRSGSETV